MSVGPPSPSPVSCEWSEPLLKYRTDLAEQHVYDKLLAHPNDEDVNGDTKDPGQGQGQGQDHGKGQDPGQDPGQGQGQGLEQRNRRDEKDSSSASI